MATLEEVQAQLGVFGTSVILVRRIDNGTSIQNYVRPGPEFPGRERWVTTNTADSAATQATAIRTNLAIP